MPDGFMGGYLDTTKALTDIANSQLLGQMNAFKLQQETTNADILARTRNSMMAGANDWGSAMMGAMPGTVPPTMGAAMPGMGVTPGQLASTEGSDQPATVGDVAKTAPKQLIDPLTDTEATKTLNLLQQSYRAAVRDATMFRQAGNVDEAEKAFGKAITIQDKLTSTQNEVRKERKEARAAISTALSNVSDQSTLNNMMSTLDDQYPGLKGFIGQRLAKDSNGDFLWTGTDNPKIIKSIGDTIRTIADQDKEADLKIQRALQAERLAEQVRENKERDDARRRDEAIQRDGQELRREVLGATLEQRAFLRERSLTNDVNARLNKDEIYKTFPKFENAANYASQIKAKLDAPGGYLSVTPSDMAAMKNMYADVARSFRARTGGKYDSVEAASFNGAWQSLEKTLNSIGTGQMIWNESAARDVSNTISQLSYNANRATLITSLKAADGARKQGLKNLSGVSIRGDASALARAGELKVVTEGGKDYIVIKGAKGEPDMKFLDPEANE